MTEKDYVEIEPFEFEEEQQSVAKLVHLVKGADTNLTLQILNLFKEKFLEGEIRRMKFNSKKTKKKTRNKSTIFLDFDEVIFFYFSLTSFIYPMQLN